MDNEILIPALGYLTFSIALVAGFGLALYYLMRPRRVTACSAGSRSSAVRRADAVREDRC